MRDSNTACSAVPWVHGGSTCPPECSSSLNRTHPTSLRRVPASWPATTAPKLQEVYHERVIPLSREQFIDYGSWFAHQLVPGVEETEVVSLTQGADGRVHASYRHW